MRAQIALLVLVAIGSISARPKEIKFNKNDPWFIRYPPRIVGGEEATPHEFPWIVDMRQGGHYCGGSIYNEEWVVTAAHCSMNSPSAYTLTAGDHNIDIVGDSPEQKRQVVTIIRHPAYGSGAQYSSDIALMRVAPPFEFNDVVKPVKLAPPGFPDTVRAEVSGWGALSQGGASPSELMKVNVPVVSDTVCRQAYGESAITDSMICSGEEGKDSCQGDSGGPMTCQDPQTNETVLCGIVSWGRGCAQAGFPGVYTEVSYFNEWIQSATVPPPEDNSTYVVQSEGCGGVLVGTSGKLSYKAGQAYNNNERCVWTIRTTTRSSVRFNVLQSGLGAGDSISVTEIYPGNAITKDLGDAELIANGPVILVTFRSNEVSPGQGFVLEFFGTGFPSSAGPVYDHYHLNGTTGVFQYPSSGDYPADAYVTVVLNPAEGRKPTLRFDKLDLEDAAGCQYDKLNVLSYNGDNYLDAGTYCAPPLPAPITSSDGAIVLVLTADDSVQESGYGISWGSA